MVSVGSIFLCLVFSILITFYLVLFLSNCNMFSEGIKLIFWGIIILFFRMLVPLNFPFTINIPVEYILPELTIFLYRSRIGTSLFELIILIIGIGAIVKFTYIRIQARTTYRRFVCYLEKNTERVDPVYKILNDNNISNMRVAIVPQKISPALSGMINPILVMPEWTLQEDRLEYIVRHEIEHYKNGDIWLKNIVELVECLYWWNPLTYFLKRKMYLVMELSNDQAVLKNSSCQSKLDYAKSLVATARVIDSNLYNTIPFLHNCKDLKIRVSVIVNNVQNNCFSKIRLFLNFAIILTMIFCCFTFVPEAYKVPAEIEQNSFIIPQNNSYLLKTVSGYKLYINGKYIADVEDITNGLENLEIKMEGN